MAVKVGSHLPLILTPLDLQTNGIKILVNGLAETNIALTQLIQLVENAFPDQIRAYYLHGSQADGTANACLSGL